MTTAEYPDRPYVGVLTVLMRQEKVLLVKRRFDPEAGKWGFPGGKQKLGERIFAAALRELHEETQIIAENPRFLTVLDVIDAVLSQKDKPRFHYSLICVACDWVSGEPCAGDDAEDAQWLSQSDTDHLPLCREVLNLWSLARAMQKKA